MNKSKSGFTIVELLIVIVVIGILAAIVIVAYKGVTNKAYDAAVKSDMRSNANKIVNFEAANGLLPSFSQMSQSGSDDRLVFTKQAYKYILICMNGGEFDSIYTTIRATSKSGLTLLFDTFTSSVKEVPANSPIDDCFSTCRPEGAGTPYRCTSGVTDIKRPYDGTFWSKW